MRRRAGGDGTATPERLCRFVSGEWPAGGDERDGLPPGWRPWARARLEWAQAHPDGLLGDFLDAMKSEIAMAREWLANNDKTEGKANDDV